MCRHAVILAGGKGTRLKPYTVVLPKPLMPIGEFPILEVIIKQLAQNGFSRITLAVNHQAEIIKAFFMDGSKWGVSIDYSLEDKPLGTMGPLNLVKDIPENFLVMNGDILTDLNYRQFYDDHVQNKRIFTVSSYKRIHKVDYGVLETDVSGHVIAFKEKPALDYEVSMGVYMLNREVLKLIPHNINYGFDNIMLDLINSKTPAYVSAFEGYWLDIGRPDDYSQAIDEFDSMRSRFISE
jgi:NDP-mannose synthase